MSTQQLTPDAKHQLVAKFAEFIDTYSPEQASEAMDRLFFSLIESKDFKKESAKARSNAYLFVKMTKELFAVGSKFDPKQMEGGQNGTH